MFDDLKKMFSGENLDNLRSQVDNLQDRLKKVHATGESGAGMVKVTINGNYKCTDVSLAADVMEESKDVLESLLQNAIEKANTELQNEIRLDLKEKEVELANLKIRYCE